MATYRKLSHTVYHCNYHIVWVPKYRYRLLTGAVRDVVEKDIHVLCSWKDVEILELNVQPDRVHLVCSIPPKLSVSEGMGLLKGKLKGKLKGRVASFLERFGEASPELLLYTGLLPA
jgi:putative transposase